MENIILWSSDGRASLVFQSNGSSTYIIISSLVLIGHDTENKLEISFKLPMSYSTIVQSVQTFLQTINNCILRDAPLPQKTNMAGDYFTMEILDASGLLHGVDKKVCEITINFDPRCAFQMSFLLDITVIDVFLEAAQKKH